MGAQYMALEASGSAGSERVARACEYLEPCSTTAFDTRDACAAAAPDLSLSSCHKVSGLSRRTPEKKRQETDPVFLEFTNEHAGEEFARLVRVADVLEGLRRVLACAETVGTSIYIKLLIATYWLQPK
jgi:hypothetical protein